AAALTSYDDEVGPKIGDRHQAVIPKLSSVTEDGTTLRSSPRPPPLQLWRPGVLSRAALDLALPKPRPGGAGSAELEQKMLAAFLIAKTNESERRSDGGGGGRDSPSAGGSSAGGNAAASAAAAAAAAAKAKARATAAVAAMASRAEGAGKGLFRAAATATTADVTGASERDTDGLQGLAAVVMAGEGARWRSDWPEEDRAAFRRGIFAFRRDFHRVRAAFLPHKVYGDVVEYFYRRWKRNPEYAAWKCTDQLVGRRVAKRVETTHVREGAGQAKRFETLGMRRGWVVEKEDMLLHGRDEYMFVIRYPRMGVFQVKLERVDLGTLETMLVEGSASDEDRAEEGLEDSGGSVARSSSSFHAPYNSAAPAESRGGLHHHLMAAGQRSIGDRQAQREDDDDDDDEE
ncbi:unnamed protein product, partial [Ectocarpus sp. 8 AP-2014]